MLSPTSDLQPDLSIRYNKLRSISSPIISDLAHLITHLGGKEMSNHEIDGFTQQAKVDALGLHTAAMPLTALPPHLDITTNSLATKKDPPQKVPRDTIFPSDKPKSSLKAGKIFPIHSSTPPPRQKESTKRNPDNNEDDPGIYSRAIDGVGDITHLIIASFIKTNDNIRDQLLTHFMYFSELMHANINGLQIHPLSTEKALPILTSPKDTNIPTTGTKVRDYFYIQNNFSLNPGTQNKPKAPPQTVDADGGFQFDENRQYNGPDRITGVMFVSATGNVKQAISDLLIELKGEAHQIKYKSTQRKNSKAEKMFPGVSAGLRGEGIMRSIWHGLKNCEKTLCNAKKFTIKANMDWYQLPLPVMNGYFKQVTPPKAICNLESGEYLLNKLTAYKKNGCKIFVIEYDPINNRRMAPMWDLFINSGDVERILGIRVKVQVIPPPGECDPNSITKQHWYCKHHVNYSSKVWYIQHKTVINLDRPITLAMTDGSRPPCSVSTLHQEYFDLKSSNDGTIIHGVFVCIKSANRGPSVDTTYMVSNKEAKSILTKIAHCPSTWWYWHWVKKGFTQGTILSLRNSFKSDAADNAHDSTYDPTSMTVTFMFAGDNKNQWLDQVEEEFGNDLSDHDKDNINNSGTTKEFNKDAKASLAKEMKGKDYNLEGIESRSSKQTHCTNMTGKRV
jgi:hypothetical protein